ncbi:hypothetical protein BJ875DRAFT_63843 [Amylocarpus encephaloides]|uniref:CorA-like transporter domain-containing protein n=1 Tax=Amylocarpus encephaloides TaxID=45428 RepID=A0A9P8C8Y4_9HELO|nr:hypothetical protein BJ875DRAFT_63843 [Amylocarpus encephaloides]
MKIIKTTMDMATDEKSYLFFLGEKAREEKRGAHRYPLSLSCTSTSSDLEFYDQRLSEMGDLSFCEEKDTDVNVIEVPESASPSLRKFTNSYGLDCYISKTPVPKSRVISISARSSVGPLQIIETSMRNLLDRYKVGTEFLDLLLSLGEDLKDSEAGLGKMVTREKPGGVYDTSYLYIYPESSKQGSETSWTWRRTAVFHRFDAGAKSHLWILLHPQQTSAAEQRLMKAVGNGTWGENSSINWDQLHLLILSSYTKNWLSYLNHLEASIKEDAKPTLAGTACDLERLQRLQDELIPLNARLATSLGTVRILGNLNTLLWQKKQYDEARFKGISFELGYVKHEMEGYILGVETMRERLKGCLSCISQHLIVRAERQPHKPWFARLKIQ